MDEAQARVGRRIGNYLLHGILGRGGMGVVYRGEHAYLRRPVAVKVLHRSYFDQPEARARFLREAQAAGVIDHPNIVGVTDFGEADDGTIFLVMNHVDGVSLERVLRNEDRLPLFRTLVILGQLTRALAAAHDKNIIHHDLKPDNIMLERRVGRRQIVRSLDGEGGSLAEPEGTFDFVTILDFGAAKYLDQAAVGSGVVIGTPTYMAPETARDGIADGRSDIYAVGIIFYEMLTGTVPFEGDVASDIMMKHLREPVPSPRMRCPQAEITLEAERTLMKALAKDPAQRYQSMAELHDDLERCYGQVRFRRNIELLPGAAASGAARQPVPLVKVKLRVAGSPGDGERTIPSVPAPQADLPADSTPSPLLLTRRRSGRHKTLPLGAALDGTPPPIPGGKPPKG
jgi:serine/threonine protein kinase